MISYNPKSWLHMIFALHKSDTIRMLWKELTYIGIFTLVISYIEITYFPEAVILEKLISVYSLIGFVISMLLIFRTNTAYDRWWEGRKKWGELVNDSRNLSVKIATFISKSNTDDIDFFRRMISNFVFASKEHLRKGIIFEELELLEDERALLTSKNHVPAAIVQLIYQRLNQLKINGLLSVEEFIILDKNLNKLLDSIGACERIKKTPIPFSYSLFIKKFVFIYVTTLPLAFVTIFGYFSAFIATFIFYVLVSIEVLAEEIEDPFGNDDNDLPTDQLCETIRANVNEILG
jgi:ion channel-forming bestrophin family protein